MIVAVFALLLKEMSAAPPADELVVVVAVEERLDGELIYFGIMVVLSSGAKMPLKAESETMPIFSVPPLTAAFLLL